MPVMIVIAGSILALAFMQNAPKWFREAGTMFEERVESIVPPAPVVLNTTIVPPVDLNVTVVEPLGFLFHLISLLS